MKLSKQFTEAVSSEETRMKLALEIGISFTTLRRWLFDDQEKIATLQNIAAIEKITGLKQEEIFEPETENQEA